MNTPYPGMTLRPYQLLCAVCALGADQSEEIDLENKRVLDSLKQNPDQPITLRCQVGEIFAYQDCGAGDDTPEGAEYNLRRDLEILHKLDLIPGGTLPARALFYRILERIETTSGICGYDRETAPEWKGCPKARSGQYEKGRAKGIYAIVPCRSEKDMQNDKASSLAAMYQAGEISVRPHILLCAVCQYGGGIRPPYAEDNLPELIELMLKQPDTRIKLVPNADWMMCAPCPQRLPEINGCVNQMGAGGLPNQMRDLRMLQKLGLTFGATRKAREIYRLIFERISGTLEVCRLDHPKPSVWCDGCGSPTSNSEQYEKGKQMLMAELGN